VCLETAIVCPCLFPAIQLYWNFKLYCFYFFPKYAFANGGCGLSKDAAYTRTFTVIYNTVMVKMKLNVNLFGKTTQLKNSSAGVMSVWKKSTWRVAFLSLKQQLVEDLQYMTTLLYHSLSMGNISKTTTKFLELSEWKNNKNVHVANNNWCYYLRLPWQKKEKFVLIYNADYFAST